MLRTIGVLAVAGLAIVVVALDGRLGPIDLTDLTDSPPALLAFAGASALVLLGLRHI